MFHVACPPSDVRAFLVLPHEDRAVETYGKRVLCQTGREVPCSQIFSREDSRSLVKGALTSEGIFFAAKDTFTSSPSEVGSLSEVVISPTQAAFGSDAEIVVTD